MLAIEPDFILLDFAARDAEHVIMALSERLVEHDAVERNYGEETFARELKHPTGLPTKPFAIAFPHAEAEGVFQVFYRASDICQAAPRRLAWPSLCRNHRN